MENILSYGLVEDGKLAEGPSPLPNSFRTEDTEILAFNTISNPEDYGWYPWIDDPLPEFDEATQTFVSEATFDPAKGLIIRSHTVVPLAINIPDTIEDWQLAGQAAVDGIITEDAALDWSGAGIIPANLVQAVNATITNPADRFAVKIFLRGTKLFNRHHPRVAQLAPLFGMDTPEKVEAFWLAASKR